jgi:hypothetical protein
MAATIGDGMDDVTCESSIGWNKIQIVSVDKWRGVLGNLRGCAMLGCMMQDQKGFNILISKTITEITCLQFCKEKILKYFFFTKL